MMFFRRGLLIVIVVLLEGIAGAMASPDHIISLDLQTVTVQDALHVLANQMGLNIVLAPTITGSTSLHLQHVSAEQAFNSVLASHHLRKWQMDHIWYVGLQADEDEAPLVTRTWQIHFAKAEDIARLLQDAQHSLLSKRGQVRVDQRTNILCVRDMASQMDSIDQLIVRLDIAVPQVLIKVRLASVDQDYQRDLGLQFLTGTDTAVSGSTRNGLYNLAIAKLADGNRLDMQLSALETEGHGELISNPSLFTASQQTASIEAGEEIPYQEISKSGATGVAFKKAVLSLKVTPQVMPGQQVLLQLQVNQDKPNNRIVLGVPAISTRQINTQILVKNGQTIVLGGIFEKDREQEEHRVPFLGRIPFIGGLFRQRSVVNNKRELLMFVTPQIIH